MTTPQEPSKLQALFSLLIAYGIYDPFSSGAHSSCYMCAALRIAYNHERITRKQRDDAIEEIQQYLLSLGATRKAALKVALQNSGLPHEPQDLLNIFQDWNNRPKVKA